MKTLSDGSPDEPIGAARQQADPSGPNEGDEEKGAHSGVVTIARPLLARVLRPLRGADVKIYLALCLRCGPEGIMQAPVSELARDAGVGVRTVYGSLKRLQKAGLVHVESRVGGSTANTYRIFTNLEIAP
jgi:DNA-binding transcriptional ArsR family regulator